MLTHPRSLKSGLQNVTSFFIFNVRESYDFFKDCGILEFVAFRQEVEVVGTPLAWIRDGQSRV